MNRLERLQALERGATKGPWETRRWPHRATELIGPADPERPGYRLLVKPHKDLIYAAALRNAAPDLIRVAVALQDLGHESGCLIDPFSTLTDEERDESKCDCILSLLAPLLEELGE